ncbi:MAG: F0F1 ATP synthase subunit A [Candidatus Aminicenantes bacterium]|nr:F0F1 ATP synthase subunit A [Candidatus Aminicenantes bacterium]
MEEKLWIVEEINKILGPVVIKLFSYAGIHLNPKEPIPGHVILSFLASLTVIIVFGLLSGKPKLVPDKKQSIFEQFFMFIEGLNREIIGHEGRNYLGIVGTLFLFILTMNYFGLFPGLASPTTNINVPAGMAIFVFLYYNLQGIKKHKFGYIKQFTGNYLFIAPIMAPIEFVSHISRPLSLSVRLFGNITAEETLILVLAGLFAPLLPVPLMALALITGALQAYIFAMLTAVYISGAVSEEH